MSYIQTLEEKQKELEASIKAMDFELKETKNRYHDLTSF